MDFTSNDLTSNPVPGAGFGPHAIVEHTPLTPLDTRSLADIAKKSLDDSLFQDMADPSDIFTKKVDPMAEYKPERFDPEATGFDRYKDSPYMKEFGFDPSLQGVEKNDAYYSGNELKYQQAATWGSVMSSAMGQFAGLAWNSFKGAAVSDGRFISAIFDPTSWNSLRDFTKNAEGTPEQLLEQDKEMKDIMNKYAIYASPETDNSVLNKESFGSMVGQLGFTVGTGAYVIAETLLTEGLLTGVTAFTKGRSLVRMGKLMEALKGTKIEGQAQMIYENARKTRDFSKSLDELTTLSAGVVKDRTKMEALYAGMKNLVPGYQAVNDTRLAVKAGATFGQAVGAGLPGLIKNFTMFGAARAEAGMEAAGTYGQMYMGLMDQYERDHGVVATGDELERIKQTSYNAATDNFIVNTGILMAANSIEFGAMMSKFSSSRRLLREAAENAGTEEAKGMQTIFGTAKRDLDKGIKTGQAGAKVYDMGRFGAMGNLNAIRKDFGLGTALHEFGKSWIKGAGKFELSEGLQEILQETSNKTISDYYTNLYNANKKIDGTDFTDISKQSWNEGLGEQMNMQGWKTFLMGATTGLFLSPISGAVMYGRDKVSGMINKDYAALRNQRKNIIKDNIAISNQWYSDAFNSLRENVAGFKTSTHAVKSMMEALGKGDEYTFFNSKDDVFTKASGVAFKTGNGEHFINSLLALGDGRMTNEEFRDAMGIVDTGNGKPFDQKVYVRNIANQVQNYYNSISNIKDQFASDILPESEAADNSLSNVHRKAFDEAAELVAALSYHGKSVVERALKIKEKTADIDTVGQASSRAFEILGNPYEIAEEIKVQQAKIDAYKGLSGPDAKEQISQAQGMIDALEKWKVGFDEYEKLKGDPEASKKGIVDLQSNLLLTFKAYLEAHNTMHGRNINISMNDVATAFKNLGDYMQLNKDFGQYTQAVNVLMDPVNFTTIHRKIAQGIGTALAANSIKHEEEIKARAEATTEPDDDEEAGGATPGAAPVEPDEKANVGTGKEITVQSIADKLLTGIELEKDELDFYLANQQAVDEELATTPPDEAPEGEQGTAQEGTEAGTGTTPEPFTLSKEMEAIKNNLVAVYSFAPRAKLSTEAEQFLEDNPELKEKLEDERIELRRKDQAGEIADNVSKYIDDVHKPALRTMILDYMEQLENKEKGTEGEAETETGTEEDTAAGSTTGEPVSKVERIQKLIDEIPPIEQDRIDNDNTVKAMNAIFAYYDKPLISTYSEEAYKEARNLTSMAFQFTFSNLKHFKEEFQKYFDKHKDLIEKAENKKNKSTGTPVSDIAAQRAEIEKRNTFTRKDLETTAKKDTAFAKKGSPIVDEDIVASTLRVGDKITFFSEKEKTGVWDGKFVVGDKNGMPSGLLGILLNTNNWLRNDTKISEELAALGKEEAGTTEEGEEIINSTTESGESVAKEALIRTGKFPLADLIRTGYISILKTAEALNELRSLKLFNINAIDPSTLLIHIVRNGYEIRQTDDGKYQLFHSVLGTPVNTTIYDKLEDAGKALELKNEPTYLSKGMAVNYPLKRDEFTIAVYSNGVLIGYINNPERFDEIFKDVTNADQFAEIVDIGRTPKEVAYNNWLESRKKLNLFEEIVANAMLESDGFIIDGDTIGNLLDLHRIAIFDTMNTPAQVVNRPTLNQMEAAGVEVVQIRKTENSNYVINKGEVLPGEVVPAIPSTFIRQFAALVRKDNQLFWIEMSPSVISDESFNNQLAEAQDLLQSISDETGNINEVVSRLSEIFTTFITSDPSSVLNFVEVDVKTFDGKVKISLKVNPKTLAGTKKKPFYTTLVEVKPGTDLGTTFFSAENKIEAFLAAINGADTKLQEWAKKEGVSLGKEHLNVTRTRLRQVLHKDPSMDDLMGMQVGVSTDVIKSYNIKFSAKQSSIPSDVIPAPPAQNAADPVSVNGGTTVVEEPSSSAEQATEKTITTSEQIKQKTEEVASSLGANPTMAEILAGIATINPPSSDIAKKILSTQQFTDNSVVNIDVFTRWCSENLPIDILVQDLGTLSTNLLRQNITVGQFITALKTIQVYRNTPYKYHEAFHAVFRLLLTDEQIVQMYMQAAKEHPVTQEKLDKFRKEYVDYAYMGDEQLAERYLEEYLADKFDTWMTKKNIRTSSGIKALFKKIADWVESVFAKLTGRDIEAFFYDINNGKYKNARIQDNQFTRNEITASIPAPKLIKVGEDIVIGLDGNPVSVPRYIPQAQGIQLVSSISALFHRRRSTDAVQLSTNKLLDEILDIYQDTLNPSQKVYESRLAAIDDNLEKVKWVMRLNNRYIAFTQQESRESIKEAVKEYLTIMGYKTDMEEDELENEEARNGVRTTADYEKSADMFGGYSSLSKILRQYIGSTTMFATDEFGNTHFLSEDGQQLDEMIEAVPAAQVYNGMLKILANTSDEQQLMAKMLLYRKEGRNPATIAFIDFLLKETGFESDNNGNWTVSKNPMFLEQVIKDFNKYETEPLFMEFAINGGVKAYNSNRQDSAKVQFDKWAAANSVQYMSQLNGVTNRTKIIKEAFAPFAKLEGVIGSAFKENAISDIDLANLANEISGQFKDKLGIDIHPSFIKYSIVFSKSEAVRTPDQNLLYNAMRGIPPINVDDINGIKSAMESKSGNIFSLDKEGSASRLIQIAAANAYFDETVDSMTYMGADGEMRYTSQFPNYNMIRVRELNQEKTINELRESKDHDNFLLKEGSDFMQMSNRGRLKTQNVDGIKVREEIKEEEVADNRDVGYTTGSLEIAKGEGVAFKTMDESEHQMTMILGYGAQNGKVQTGPKKNDYFYSIPVMLSVIEAKSTANMVRMPVINTVSTSNNSTSITSDTLDKFYSFVKQEIEMIRRVDKEIAEGGNIVGYHTGKKNEDGTWKEAPRGLRLYNTKLWFSPEMREKIETNALDPNYVFDENEIKAEINKYLKTKINGYIDYLEKLGFIATKNGKVVNKLMPAFVFEGFKDPSTERDMKMNLMAGNFRHNISQIFLNDFLNTIALRQLLYGNEAKAFKNNIDRIKRMAGPNSSGRNVSFIFTAPELGILHNFTTFHHITYKSTPFKKMSDQPGKSTGDKDDAQMYCTAKGMRYALFGFGKLTKQQADIISKMERGEPVTQEEFFGAGGIKENKGATNSMKVVYFDNNNVYLKCSMIPLYRELTSMKDSNGNWIAKPYMRELHDFLNKLEEFEAGVRRDEQGYIIRDENGIPVNHGETIVYAGPDTHSKGLKENVAENISAVNNSHFKQLDAKYFRLQMENPSNKLVITDPTQAKQQIMSEQDDTLMVDFLGEQKSVGEIKQMYMADVASRLTNNYESAVRQMFNLEDGFIELNKSIELNKVTPQLANFFKIMKETLQATGSDQQTLDFLEVREGEPIYDMNFPAILPKYTQIFFSYFSKIMAEKTPGIVVALVSDAGIQRIKQVLEVFPEGHEKAGQPKRWKVITDAEYTRDPYKYRDAKRWDDEENRTYYGLQKGDYIIDDLRHNYMKYDQNGKELGYFSEYMRPAHWKEEMGGIVKALMNGFGIRIPSDDKHQYITLEMVDTLPVMYGSSAVFPQELIEISGADFDIDKLYIQLADTYVVKRNGVTERFAYGLAETNEEKMIEWLIWQLSNKTPLSKMLKEKLDNDQDVKELRERLEVLRAFKEDLSGQWESIEDYDWRDIVIRAVKKQIKHDQSLVKSEYEEIEETIADIRDAYLRQSFRELGLPVDEKAFEEAGGENLNNGFLNNRILAAKIAMLNNEKISGGGKDAIINAATSTDPLVSLVKDLIEKFSGQDTAGAKAILAILEEPEVDINDLQGKSMVFINNKEGQRNIGAAINSMLVFSLAEQFGLSVSDTGLYYNNRFYNSFEEANTDDGVRKFAQISAIVNAMTDNAKERLAAKLGLNIEAVGMVSTMVALGVPLKDATLHMLQPSVRTFFAEVRRNKGVFGDSSISSNFLLKKYIKGYAARLVKQYNLAKDTTGNIVFTPEVVEKMKLNEEKLIQNISENGTDSAFEYRALANLQYIMDLSGEFRNAAAVMKLNQGMDTTWEENDDTQEKIDKLVVTTPSGEQLSIMDFETPMRMHPIFGTYLKIFEQLNRLAPKVFLERTPAFRQTMNMFAANMGKIDKEFMKKAKNNLISYLSIKAYVNWLKKNGYGNVLKTLDNALIYHSEQEKKEAGYKNIAQILRELKQSTSNYLANEFLRYVEAADVTNKGNIHKAMSNNWAKLTENQQQRLYDSFIELYNNEETKMNAVALFNYLLVKDGGQFKSGSFIKYIPPFAFKDLLDRTKEVNELFASGTESNSEYVALFGEPKEQLLSHLLLNYGTHILNRDFVKDIQPTMNIDSNFQVGDTDKDDNSVDADEINNFAAIPITELGDIIKIDVFAGIRPSIIESRNQYGIVVEASNKKGSFTATERRLKAKNQKALEESGFSIVKGEKAKEVRFPFTIMRVVDTVDDEGISKGKKRYLFRLKSVGKEEGIGNVLSMLAKGELAPQGTSAVYERVEHTGSYETWEAESATGTVPVTPVKEKIPFNVDGTQYSPSIAPSHSEKTDVEPFLVEVPVEKKPAQAKAVADIPQNKVSGVESFGSTVEANDAVKKVLGPNPHSIDMIVAGLRTRTTRSAQEMTKYNVKVGDTVKHFGKSADGTTKTVYAKVTAIHPKDSAAWSDTWEKEGWLPEDISVINRFGPGAAAIEFEVINPAAPASVQPVSAQGVAVKGENIASTSKGIAAALTNPTELAKQKGNLVNSYPVVYNGVTYKDAEAAYQANKAPYLANKTTGKLMVDIITAKLQQHPSLVKGIDAKGGEQWLRSSTHIVKGDNFWETGAGKQNAFMNALIQAYKNVKQSPTQGTHAPIAQIDGSKLLNNVGDEIKLVLQATYKQVNLTYTISNIEETSNGYIVTLKGRGYNGTTKETVIIENGKVVLSTRRYGGKDLPTDLSKASYNFRFAEQPTQAPVRTSGIQDASKLSSLQKVPNLNAEVFIGKTFTDVQADKITNLIKGWYDKYYGDQKATDKFGAARRSLYFSDTSYTYSGVTRPAIQMPKELNDMVRYIESTYGFQPGYFDMALVNEYKDGNQKIGYHTDNEAILNAGNTVNPTVITMGFGQERQMMLQDIKTGKLIEKGLPSTNGSIIIMGTDSQINYKHGINTEKNATGVRYSITLRHNAVKAKESKQAPVSETTNTGTQYPNKPEFNKLPAKLDKPTMTYAGIGSRRTPAEILPVMTELAKELAKRGYALNSGAAPGPDSAFEAGAGTKKNIFPGNVKTGERELKIAEEIHPNWNAMIAAAKRNAIQKGKNPEAAAAYVANLMARNTNQVFGKNLDTPVDFVTAYTPDNLTDYTKRTIDSGGTGQAIDMASRKGIPVINMADPNWRSQLDAVINRQSSVSETNVSLPSKQMTGEQWQQELSDIYSSKERTEGKREWIIQQLNFRDQSRSMGATDEQILNTIKCL